MSKERLEEIEKNLDPLGYGMGGHLISVNDIYWLVGYAKEQAERVQELEDKLARIRFINNDYDKQNKLYWEFINNIKTASEQPISYDELLGVIQSEYKALEESE